MSDWYSYLNDDCTLERGGYILERYGYIAHVGCIGHKVWWFAVGRGNVWPGFAPVYNTADNEIHVALTTGKMARAAAECIIEFARQMERQED